MKLKTLFLTLMLSLVLGFSSCTQCKSGDTATDVDSTEFVQTKSLVVENVISADREAMFLQYKHDYRWFETCIVMNDFLDEEPSELDTLQAGPVIEGISNVFMYVDSISERSFDATVVLFSHTPDSAVVEVKPHAFWVEDRPLNEAEIKLTFAQAYERLMEANVAKPHSRYCVLRREVGAKDANAQYIFGNTHTCIFVDAVTGDVRLEDPAFEGIKLAKPLGEWP